MTPMLSEWGFLTPSSEAPSRKDKRASETESCVPRSDAGQEGVRCTIPLMPTCGT